MTEDQMRALEDAARLTAIEDAMTDDLRTADAAREPQERDEAVLARIGDAHWGRAYAAFFDPDASPERFRDAFRVIARDYLTAIERECVAPPPPDGHVMFPGPA